MGRLGKGKAPCLFAILIKSFLLVSVIALVCALPSQPNNDTLNYPELQAQAEPFCGDGFCQPGEEFQCEPDCPCDFNQICDVNLGEASRFCDDCFCGDGVCDAEEDISCSDCQTSCGDGFCDPQIGEDVQTCPADCACGDGICDANLGEDATTCSDDCRDGFCPNFDPTDADCAPVFAANATPTGIQQNSTTIVNPDGSFAICWEGQSAAGGFNVFFRRFNALGVPLDLNDNLINTTSPARDVDCAIDPRRGGFLAVWVGPDGDGDGILAQRVNANGTFNGSELQLNAITFGNDSNPKAVTNSALLSDTVIVWTSENSDFPGSTDISAAILNSIGSIVVPQFLVASAAQSLDLNGDPNVGFEDFFTFATAYRSEGANTDGRDIFIQSFDVRTGVPVDNPLRVNAFTPGDQDNPTTLSDPATGDINVVYESTDNTTGRTDVKFQRYTMINRILTKQGSERQVTLDSGIIRGSLDAAEDTQPFSSFVFFQNRAALGVSGAPRGTIHDSNGVRIANVELFDSNQLSEPSVAVGSGGEIVVSATGNDLDQTGIFFQKLPCPPGAGFCICGDNNCDSFEDANSCPEDCLDDNCPSDPNNPIDPDCSDIDCRLEFICAGPAVPLEPNVVFNAPGDSFIEGGDVSGNDINFTTNVFPTVPGLINNAFEYRPREIMSTDPTTLLGNPQTGTISAWVKPEASAGSAIFTIVGDPSGLNLVSLSLLEDLQNLNSGGILQGRLEGDQGQSVTVTAPTPLDPDRWQYVAFTWDGSNVILYLDGLHSVDQGYSFNNRTDQEGAIDAGSLTGAAVALVQVDELEFHSVARTEAEIFAVANAGKNGRLREGRASVAECSDTLDNDNNGATDCIDPDFYCAAIDQDGDGSGLCDDCDDNDPNSFPGNPERCDGTDNDCDGTADNGFNVGVACTVGVGACEASGSFICTVDQTGTVCDAVPGTPAANDATCDGIDEDCDGLVDEDFVSTVTNCGVGACGASGATSCVAGVVQDSCTPGTPALNDTTCDGVDDDCDALIDEDFVATTTTCGVGACASGGATSCVAGVVQDSCTPGEPALSDPSCDGVDDDCDGLTDEDFLSTPTSCGVGECAANGATQCVGGAVQDSCAPGAPAPDDSLCDGLDNDCDNAIDEDAADTDGDGTCDALDACPNDADNDSDGDGFCADVDNCPAIANTLQTDTDLDGQGDACDSCPNDPDNDSDGDGICGDVDNCPDDANPDQFAAPGSASGCQCDPFCLDASWQQGNSIRTNVASMRARAGLQQFGTEIQVAITRLSSGLRVNSSKDDAAGLTIGETLRGSVSGIRQVARDAQGTSRGEELEQYNHHSAINRTAFETGPDGVHGTPDDVPVDDVRYHYTSGANSVTTTVEMETARATADTSVTFVYDPPPNSRTAIEAGRVVTRDIITGNPTYILTPRSVFFGSKVVSESDCPDPSPDDADPTAFDVLVPTSLIDALGSDGTQARCPPQDPNVGINARNGVTVQTIQLRQEFFENSPSLLLPAVQIVTRQDGKIEITTTVSISDIDVRRASDRFTVGMRFAPIPSDFIFEPGATYHARNGLGWDEHADLVWENNTFTWTNAGRFVGDRSCTQYALFPNHTGRGVDADGDGCEDADGSCAFNDCAQVSAGMTLAGGTLTLNGDNRIDCSLEGCQGLAIGPGSDRLASCAGKDPNRCAVGKVIRGAITQAAPGGIFTIDGAQAVFIGDSDGLLDGLEVDFGSDPHAANANLQRAAGMAVAADTGVRISWEPLTNVYLSNVALDLTNGQDAAGQPCVPDLGVGDCLPVPIEDWPTIGRVDFTVNALTLNGTPDLLRPSGVGLAVAVREGAIDINNYSISGFEVGKSLAGGANVDPLTGHGLVNDILTRMKPLATQSSSGQLSGNETDIIVGPNVFATFTDLKTSNSSYNSIQMAGAGPANEATPANTNGLCPARNGVNCDSRIEEYAFPKSQIGGEDHLTVTSLGRNFPSEFTCIRCLIGCTENPNGTLSKSSGGSLVLPQIDSVDGNLKVIPDPTDPNTDLTLFGVTAAGLTTAGAYGVAPDEHVRPLTKLTITDSTLCGDGPSWFIDDRGGPSAPYTDNFTFTNNCWYSPQLGRCLTDADNVPVIGAGTGGPQAIALNNQALAPGASTGIDPTCAVDGDQDATCDRDDNCPEDTNSGQEDVDLDTIGNACDPVCAPNPPGSFCTATFEADPTTASTGTITLEDDSTVYTITIPAGATTDPVVLTLTEEVIPPSISGIIPAENLQVAGDLSTGVVINPAPGGGTVDLTVNPAPVSYDFDATLVTTGDPLAAVIVRCTTDPPEVCTILDTQVVCEPAPQPGEPAPQPGEPAPQPGRCLATAQTNSNSIFILTEPRDTDGDGVPDANDCAPNDPLKAADADGDGVCDPDDACPNDPNKSTDPGQCGCGIPDTDTDNDGTADCNDCAPNDATIHPGAVESCDGIDNDCDSQVDEDFTDLGQACSAGIGACLTDGVKVCSATGAGTECNAVPGQPAPSDATCDGVDDDCDALTDEDFASTPTSCGVGACGASGATSCVAGTVVDSCTPGTPAANDATCDGIDDDCDALTDEDFVATPTSCGVGACGASGATSCVAGSVQDSCTPGTPAANDATCDGVDDDCDALTDEDFASTPTSCGVGACGASGATSCLSGAVVDSCTPGTPAANDATCDGVDDDCDALTDEDFTSTPTSCGVGECAATGATQCVAGVENDTCAPGAPTEEICDDLDNNCDGEVDDGGVCDADDDGIADADDSCPTIAGLTELIGCPVLFGSGIKGEFNLLYENSPNTGGVTASLIGERVEQEILFDLAMTTALTMTPIRFRIDPDMDTMTFIVGSTEVFQTTLDGFRADVEGSEARFHLGTALTVLDTNVVDAGITVKNKIRFTDVTSSVVQDGSGADVLTLGGTDTIDVKHVPEGTGAKTRWFNIEGAQPAAPLEITFSVGGTEYRLRVDTQLNQTKLIDGTGNDILTQQLPRKVRVSEGNRLVIRLSAPLDSATKATLDGLGFKARKDKIKATVSDVRLKANGNDLLTGGTDGKRLVLTFDGGQLKRLQSKDFQLATKILIPMAIGTTPGRLEIDPTLNKLQLFTDGQVGELLSVDKVLAGTRAKLRLEKGVLRIGTEEGLGLIELLVLIFNGAVPADDFAKFTATIIPGVSLEAPTVDGNDFTLATAQDADLEYRRRHDTDSLTVDFKLKEADHAQLSLQMPHLTGLRQIDIDTVRGEFDLLSDGVLLLTKPLDKTEIETEKREGEGEIEILGLLTPAEIAALVADGITVETDDDETELEFPLTDASLFLRTQ